MKPQQQIQALQRLKQTTQSLLQRLKLDVAVEVEGDSDEPWLVVDHGFMVAWVDDGKFVVDETVDTSDPSVGIFGGYEPRSWGEAEPILVTHDEIGAASKLVTGVVERTIEMWAADEDEYHYWKEHHGDENSM